jgi:hypothetical protein
LGLACSHLVTVPAAPEKISHLRPVTVTGVADGFGAGLEVVGDGAGLEVVGDGAGLEVVGDGAGLEVVGDGAGLEVVGDGPGSEPPVPGRTRSNGVTGSSAGLLSSAHV